MIYLFLNILGSTRQIFAKKLKKKRDSSVLSNMSELGQEEGEEGEGEGDAPGLCENRYLYEYMYLYLYENTIIDIYETYVYVFDSDPNL